MVGVLRIAKKFEAEIPTLLGTAAFPVERVTFTSLLPELVPDPMMIFRVVAFTSTQLVALVMPTTALQVAGDASCDVVMKFLPITVMMLLT